MRGAPLHMIVKCDQCQTRFRIPDEKVVDRPNGVKVRCTKCHHTFRVKVVGSGTPAAPPPVAPVVPAIPPAEPRIDDPFARFAPLSPQVARQVFGEETRVAAVSEADVAASAGREWQPPESSLPPEVFEPQTQVRGPPAPVPAVAPVNAWAAGASNGASMELPPLDDLFGAAEPPPPIGAAAPARKAESETAAPSSASGALSFAPPPPPPEDVDLNDFFGATDSSSAHEPVTAPNAAFADSTEEQPDSPTVDRRSELFDLPPPSPAEVPQPPGPAVVERLPLPAHAALPMAATGSALPSASRSQTGLRVVGLVANLLLAGVLLAGLLLVAAIFLHEGTVERASFSAERLREVFSAEKRFVTTDLSSGLYDTRGGRSVFFVRGVVANRSETRSRARVRVELLDGRDLVQRVEGWAGATLSPEELYSIEKATDVEALARRLEEGARLLEPGTSAGFVVAFYDYPPDLGAFRVRVSVEAAELPAGTATR